MKAEEVLQKLSDALRKGWIVQLDYTEYDGFRAWKRRWNTDFEMFFSQDDLADAIIERLDEDTL